MRRERARVYAQPTRDSAPRIERPVSDFSVPTKADEAVRGCRMTNGVTSPIGWAFVHEDTELAAI